MVKKGLNYFSSTEQPFESRFSKFRDLLFAPVGSLFSALGVSSNFVSILGLSMLLGVWFFFVSNPKLASVFLLLYVLFDGIDGCVARRTKTASNAGGFVDIVCDQTGMAVVTVLLMANGLISPLLGGLYIYAYCLMIVVTVARNILKASPRWIFRTKYFLFIVYGAWAFNFGAWFRIFFLIATPLTILFALIGCFELYRRLKRVR